MRTLQDIAKAKKKALEGAARAYAKVPKKTRSKMKLSRETRVAGEEYLRTPKKMGDTKLRDQYLNKLARELDQIEERNSPRTKP